MRSENLWDGVEPNEEAALWNLIALSFAAKTLWGPWLHEFYRTILSHLVVPITARPLDLPKLTPIVVVEVSFDLR